MLLSALIFVSQPPENVARAQIGIFAGLLICAVLFKFTGSTKEEPTPAVTPVTEAAHH
jgi:hypothetical protein